MQIADGHSKGVNTSRRHEGLRAVRCRERLTNLGVIDALRMNVRATAEVMRFALDAGARGPGIFDDLPSGRDDVLVGGVLLRLAQVDMNELEPGIDRRFRGLPARRMIEVDVHLDAEFGLVVVNHRAEVVQADHLDLAMARLYEDWALLRGGGSGDGDERFLVVDVEGAQSKAFLPGAGIEDASGFSIRHQKTSYISVGPIDQDITTVWPGSWPIVRRSLSPRPKRLRVDGRSCAR